MRLRAFRWPIAFLALAVGVLAASYFVANRYNPTPLVLPIPLKAGAVVSPAFRVDQALPYLIELEVERQLPFETLQCLIGEQFQGHDCGNIHNVVDIHWRILEGSAVIAAGASRSNSGAGYGPTIEKTLGEFNAAPGHSYTVQIEVRGSLEELRPTNPRLLVQLHPIHTKGAYVISALLQLATLPILAVALISSVIVGIRLRRAASAT